MTEKNDSFIQERCDAIGNRIIRIVVDEIGKQQLDPEERIVVMQDIAAFLLASTVSQYKRPARKRVENLFINLMHLKLSVFDEAHEHLKHLH